MFAIHFKPMNICDNINRFLTSVKVFVINIQFHISPCPEDFLHQLLKRKELAFKTVTEYK
jgi:hypothetical protein